ncbi:acetyltransferase [Methylopila jiangsuensis]|uniref:Acetyltransferase n=1 Tax=Methylopila jiangsuensis TaxID=586230 RepID=A0A9W6JIA1_9HYPH|nr:GNAT family N-acetyltransferase [Methylopila jiangsuensis]MDR6284463.1 putative acetyltransferase [Methylopila jiangsuensis]GLK78151.1 acetyltransferase [Methylopila jiangsuensis]
MDVTVRAMRGEDAADVFEIYRQRSFREGTLALPYESFEAVRAWLEPKSPRDLQFSAECDGRVVGASALKPFYGRRAHAAEFWIGVRDDAMGKGVGSKLMAAMLDTADNWLNILRVEMTVFVDNESAIALYRKFGFEVEGTHKAASFRDGRYVDAHCMARLRPSIA